MPSPVRLPAAISRVSRSFGAPARSRSPFCAATLLVVAGLWGCDAAPTDPGVTETALRVRDRGLVEDVRRLAAENGIGALERPPRVRPQLVQLGRLLVFDPILSGNRNISCMTCHWPGFATGDGRSLSVGQGATGLGPARVHPDGVFIPRNAPPLFNLHTLRFQFWDGRVSMDDAGRFHTPAGADVTPEMEAVFEFGAVSAQGLFPVTSRDEMRGHVGSDLSEVPDGDEPTMWRILMARLGEIPEYRERFEKAYPGTSFDDMTFAHASNAMAGFYLDAFTFADTPWDRFLRGQDQALTVAELDGARRFMTEGCAGCHNGPAFTDHDFHNIALPQFGPGKGDGPTGTDDFGRMRVTGDPADRYRFRTPPLRNVALSGPYGHDGAHATLDAFIAHYSQSDIKLRTFDVSGLEPGLQGTLMDNADEIMATRDPRLEGLVLSPETVARLADFMGALTDRQARHLEQVIPRRVPSGLPVRDDR